MPRATPSHECGPLRSTVRDTRTDTGYAALGMCMDACNLGNAGVDWVRQGSGTPVLLFTEVLQLHPATSVS